MNAKRAAIYVRVSTNDQDTGLQETELREYVESRGWSCTVYRDQGRAPVVEGMFSTEPALSVVEVSGQNETDWTVTVLPYWSHDNSNDSGIP